jgi:hypothetical protein
MISGIMIHIVTIVQLIECICDILNFHHIKIVCCIIVVYWFVVGFNGYIRSKTNPDGESVIPWHSLPTSLKCMATGNPWFTLVPCKNRLYRF